MKRIEAKTAFKSSFHSDIAIVTRDQVCFEDVNVTCEDFSVDDLLDFSDKDFEEASFQESEEDETKDSFSESSNQQGSFNNNTSSDINLCNNDTDVIFGDLPVGELSIPVDEMENLEWLSQIEDDSPAKVSLLSPVGNFNWTTRNFHKSWLEPESRPVQRVKEPCFPLPVCRKPRAKRRRPIGNNVKSSSRISAFLCAEPVQTGDWFLSVGKPVVKKQKKKHAEDNGVVCGSSKPVRRCSHCLVQKTPQWRSGPLGPKTLCNACGVRYKSGRLYPEYRPACSPTFSQNAHSNSHRKVLEIRRKKEVVGVIETGLSPVVKSL